MEFDLNDDERGGTEVRSERPRGRLWPAVVVIGLGAVVVASVTLGGHGPGHTAPTTATPTATTTPAATTVTTLSTATTTNPTAPAAESTNTTAFVSLPFGRPTGLVVYLTPSSGGPSTLLAYDIDRGTVHNLDLGRDVGWYIRALDGAGGTVIDGGVIVVVQAGVARSLDDTSTLGIVDGPNGRTAAGPAGGIWVRGFNPPGIELIDPTGARTGRRYPLPAGSELYGSMADGRPVVRGDDHIAYTIEPDGTPTPLDGIPTGPVDHGHYLEVRCTPTQTCTAYGHLDPATVIALGPTNDTHGPRQYRMQPDGAYVAVETGTDLLLLDTHTGRTQTVVTGLRGGWNPTEPIPARFLPDQLGLIAQTQHGLVLIGLDGHTIADLTTGAAVIPNADLLGVGHAHPWQP